MTGRLPPELIGTLGGYGCGLATTGLAGLLIRQGGPEKGRYLRAAKGV